MLKQLWDRLAVGGTWTVASLARELGTTPELVTAMLEDLAQRGYLKPTGGACSGTCAFCPLAGRCVKDTSQKAWTLSAQSVL